MNEIQRLVTELAANEGFVAELSKQIGPSLIKADSFTTGIAGQQLVGYNLDPVVEFLYPFLKNVPLVAGTISSDGTFRYKPIPRIKSRGGTAAHWKTITAIDTNTVAGGVGRGQRGAAMRMDSNDVSSPFYGLGIEVPVDFETQYEAGDLLTPTPLAIAAQSGLRALMIAEEKIIIGGNSGLALGTPVISVNDGAPTGGTIVLSTGTTISVSVVALTLDGLLRSTIAGGIPGNINRVNVDGSVLTFGGGSSAVATGTTAYTANHTILATVTPIVGAVAYAWFWDAPGNETLGAITTVAGIEIMRNATGTQRSSTLVGDHSRNGYVPDGLITQMATPGSNSYVRYLANGSGAGAGAGHVGTGTPLTADNAGGVVEFDALLKDRWDNYRLGFSRIFINSQEAANITQRILVAASGTTSLFRVALDYSAGLYGGKRVTSYHNKYTGEELDIVIHPWMPAGTIMFFSDMVPYPLSNVANILEFETRQGYYQIDWPLSTRQWQSGVYVDEALKNHFPPAFALLSNVANA